jgi:hypothetical protein
MHCIRPNQTEGRLNFDLCNSLPLRLASKSNRLFCRSFAFRFACSQCPLVTLPSTFSVFYASVPCPPQVLLLVFVRSTTGLISLTELWLFGSRLPFDPRSRDRERRRCGANPTVTARQRFHHKHPHPNRDSIALPPSCHRLVYSGPKWCVYRLIGIERDVDCHPKYLQINLWLDQAVTHQCLLSKAS